MPDRDFEIVVVGAGPAGLAAACVAAEAGRRVALVDETPWIGGQIWRGTEYRGGNSLAARWIDLFRQTGATLLDRTCVIGVPGPGQLLAERDGLGCTLRWKRLVLATGARELFLPFPGWTLPGVMGAGGLLNLAKTGWPVEGRRIVVAGSGPLLLAAADGLQRYGARVLLIAEQAPSPAVTQFALSLCRYPRRLRQALRLKLNLIRVPYRFSTWPVRAEGNEQVSAVVLTDGRRTWSERCDALACGFGLVPNVELPLAIGCKLADDFVLVDEFQATSVKDVYCAGEPTGIGGAECALVEGQIAGYTAAGEEGRARALFAQRASWHPFRRGLARAFSLRAELARLAQPDTIVCRCEDVRLAQLSEFRGWREAKLQARCGMGPCQGRVCGPATKVLLGWQSASVRPPVSPAKVASLVADLGQPG